MKNYPARIAIAIAAALYFVSVGNRVGGYIGFQPTQEDVIVLLVAAIALAVVP